MPIYECQCDDCGTRHEKIVMAQGRKFLCPKCASSKQTMQLSVFSTSTKSGSNGGAPAGESGAGCGCTPRTCGCN